MTISVTQQDIDYGIRRNGRECPIALALHRSGIDHVVVTTRGIFIGEAALAYEEECALRYEPVKACGSAFDFMVDFDNGRKVGPMQFNLDYEVPVAEIEEEELVCV